MTGYEQELRVTPAQAVLSLTRVQSHCVWRWQEEMGAGNRVHLQPQAW